MNISKVLEWDSQFFSLKIASITIVNEDSSFLKEYLENYRRSAFDLVYVFVYNDILSPIDLFPDFTFRKVDDKVVYTYHIEHCFFESSKVVRYSENPSNLYNLAIQSGIDSRYRIDTKFQKGEFERLYKTWINNSLNGEIADDVFVYGDSTEPLGFITLKKERDCVLVGLIATDINHRCKHIGSTLLDTAKRYAYESHKSILEVATQAHNEAACAFYEKNGFMQKSRMTVYHVWLNK